MSVFSREDQTVIKVNEFLRENLNNIRILQNKYSPGFGNAVKFGIQYSNLDYVVIVMGDASEDPLDIVHFYQTAKENDLNCVFGSRFVQNSKIADYPRAKLRLNQIYNKIASWIFKTEYNDFTNAFKLYKRSYLISLFPFKSSGFSISPEICFKAVTNTQKITILPSAWKEHGHRSSKFMIIREFISYVKVLLTEGYKRLLS